MTFLLGCIADDFTGATDLANTLTRGGLRTVQVNGVPRDGLAVPDADACVVALKSRTAPPAVAVEHALRALRWLQAHGVRQVVFKICSTFDSTNAGNIGPVADALLDALHGGIALVCPAFPANGRTVYLGHLFVGHALLSDSPMKDHPLTPMRDASLLRVLGRQTARPVGLVPLAVVRRGPDAVRAALQDLARTGTRYAIADAIADEDLLTLGHAARDLPLVVGGSGIALGLPDNARAAGAVPVRASAAVAVAADGPSFVLAGSCSQATRAQVAHFARSHPALRLDPLALMQGPDALDGAVRWACEQIGRGAALVYSSASPDDVQGVQDALGADGRARAAATVEHAFARLARALVDAGVRRLVVAGGETSGAVVQALEAEVLAIGHEIDPGVPWTVVPGPQPLALALKSGNFGAVDFFDRALAAHRG